MLWWSHFCYWCVETMQTVLLMSTLIWVLEIRTNPKLHFCVENFSDAPGVTRCTFQTNFVDLKFVLDHVWHTDHQNSCWLSAWVSEWCMLTFRNETGWVRGVRSRIKGSMMVGWRGMWPAEWKLKWVDMGMKKQVCTTDTVGRYQTLMPFSHQHMAPIGVFEFYSDQNYIICQVYLLHVIAVWASFDDIQYLNCCKPLLGHCLGVTKLFLRITPICAD